MTIIKIDDVYRVEIRNYDYELIKHVEATKDKKERDITLGYFPSLKYALEWLERKKVSDLGTLTIDEYVSKLQNLESWVKDFINQN